MEAEASFEEVRSRTRSHDSKRTNEANRLLDEALKLANRCQYRLKQADIHNFLAQIERDAGNNDAAIEAATQAYRLAWCDGPPYAYHWGLQKAKAHLTALANEIRCVRGAMCETWGNLVPLPVSSVDVLLQMFYYLSDFHDVLWGIDHLPLALALEGTDVSVTRTSSRT